MHNWHRDLNWDQTETVVVVSRQLRFKWEKTPKEAYVCWLIKDGVEKDDASLPLLCEEKQRESWANRSGFSNFSSLTLIQKQFSAISWGTICNDTRIPLSPQSETVIPPSCHSKVLLTGDGVCECFCCVRPHTCPWVASLASEWQTRNNQTATGEREGYINICIWRETAWT